MGLRRRHVSQRGGRLQFPNIRLDSVMVARQLRTIWQDLPMLSEFLKQYMTEHPLLLMFLCWVEGFVVGALLVWWLL